MDIILWKDDADRVVALTPPAGMTAADAKADGALVPQDRSSFIVDNSTLPSAPLSRWRLSAEGAVTVVAADPPDNTSAEAEASRERRRNDALDALGKATTLDQLKKATVAYLKEQ